VLPRLQNEKFWKNALQTKMQVGNPSGKNGARLRRGAGSSIKNKNNCMA
jgi:hypothetical protein